MLHLFRYRFLQTIRNFPIMFWALVFPIILGTFFYISFGNAGLESTGESSWDEIKVSVVKEDVSSENARAFEEFLAQMDGETLDIQDISTEEKALKALDEEKISGIFYVKETPSLTVAKNGLNESILTSVLESFNQNSAMFQKIATTHPEKLPDAMEAMGDYRSSTLEVSLGGKDLNPSVQYFFALVAYACLSGAFLGVQSSTDGQANISALGARRSITPTHKLTLVMIDMAVLFIIHFFNILILCLYITQVLKISLGNDIGSLLLVDFMGSMIGVCLGVAIGCLARMSFGLKMGVCVLFTLFPGFLAGLMFGNMKNIIELHCPIINRINPAAVLSDAFYCMGIYNDMERFTRCLLILAVMSVLLLTVAFLGIRRERYDSI
ncbi:ABC transporter permease [Lachnospiraceae bacterium WCA-9-b2]|uniref:ABC transporter permease n=1 Tax=Sporofaciens musculi TaxID=2681861 RepID=A0A7X3MG07_9FIRM|nr:ABC transporter permease [Sporofaciens musculi]MXP75542.1 ABC transporter permease [Sporofaciens musculi]